MNRSFIFLIITVNILVIGFGGLIAISDLYLRQNTGYTQIDRKLIGVEYLPLGYRPTYEYYLHQNSSLELLYVVSEGSYTLDFLQLSIIIMVIADLVWIFFEKQKEPITEENRFYHTDA